MNDNTAGQGPLERPGRPSLDKALDMWWDAAYSEGREGRDHDTEGGAAQTALQDIWAAHSAALAAAVASERDRCAELVDFAAVAVNWNEREALAKFIRDGRRVIDRNTGRVE